MFQVKGIDQLCEIFKEIGQGRLDPAAMRVLIKRAEGQPPAIVHQLFLEIVRDARKALEKEQDPGKVLEMLAKIARFTRDPDDFAQALSLVPCLPDKCGQDRARKAIVKAYVLAGKIREARRLASQIKSYYWQAEAFIVIAHVTCDIRDIHLASQAREHVLSHGDEIDA